MNPDENPSGETVRPSDKDFMSIRCDSCGTRNNFRRLDPLFGKALVCSACSAPLVPIHEPDPRCPMPIEPSEVSALFGLEHCSIEHPRCPWCQKINYCIVFPERGLEVGWYANREQENPKANFVIEVECVHCCKQFVVEWDGWPFPIERLKRCNFCSGVGFEDVQFGTIPEENRRHFEYDLGQTSKTMPYLKDENGAWLWIACPTCLKTAAKNHRSQCAFVEGQSPNKRTESNEE